MPELPEVQTIVNELKETIVGESILSCHIHRRSVIVGEAEDFSSRITNRRIQGVERIGKYIVFDLAPDINMIAHLKMTGKFIFQPDSTIRKNHDRVSFTLSSGNKLVFTDIRCFGKLEIIQRDKKDIFFSKLGWDPWSGQLSSGNLRRRLANRSLAIKSALLDQSIIAGIGNIYASEALFHARLSPTLPANRLTRAELNSLILSIRAILKLALKYNGTTISDFKRVDEKSGEFQNFLRVYGKSGMPCKICGTKINKIVQNQRSTFFCPQCQSAP